MPRRHARLERLIVLAASVAALSGSEGQRLVFAQRDIPLAFDLEEITIAALQQRMETGRDSARSITEKYLARIAALDRTGPALHSIIEINPDALRTADALDQERRTRGPRGPLHGIPLLLKDNIATDDQMLTTAGSLVLAGRPAGKDAFVANRLRAAGAIILGKANMAEWAGFRDLHFTNGWSARGGQTKNPYALDRSPLGSSSGPAVATAANLTAAAIGTETDGSIVDPSSTLGLVGIKPTLGLVSRTGIVPIAHSQDTPGPMARTVADAAALLSALAVPDPEDPSTLRAPAVMNRDFTVALDPDGLRGARLGIVRDKLFGYSRAADNLAERAIADMKARGAVVIDPANIPTIGKFEASELDVLLYEFKPDLARYFQWLGSGAPVHTLREVIAFNEAHSNEELRLFGQSLMIASQMKGPLTSSEYNKKLSAIHRLAGAEGIDAVMAKYKLDALVAPTMGPAILLDAVTGDHYNADEIWPASVAAVAGYPHITVPMGSFRGLPIGLSFFGRAWSEGTLIRIAYAYEQATKHRRPPAFPLSINPNP
jgi:amidase